ncbi:MAG: hypothetical protein EPN75_03315 [Beijerinckiaceae bacterium]|nr:MAG: hypothetical protein EPN75_03315 [Beijerinckiaceae bacterium]
MSKRDPLKQLIKKFPAPEDLRKIIEGLAEESDRSAAIVAASILEGLLERVIIHRLKNKDTNLIGQLFSNRGPLSDFHSKILIASAFGIIGRNAELDLNRIKTIRNVFAHAVHPVSFDTPEIHEEIGGFIVLDAMYKTAEKGKHPLPRMPNKQAYLLAVHVLCIAYDGAHQQMGGKPIMEYFADCNPYSRASKYYPLDERAPSPRKS